MDDTLVLSRFEYLEVHLCEADEHPGNETLPESGRNEAHLEEALHDVAGLLAEAVDVHGWLGGQEVGQQVATARTQRNHGEHRYINGTNPKITCGPFP